MNPYSVPLTTSQLSLAFQLVCPAARAIVPGTSFAPADSGIPFACFCCAARVFPCAVFLTEPKTFFTSSQGFPSMYGSARS